MGQNMGKWQERISYSYKCWGQYWYLMCFIISSAAICIAEWILIYMWNGPNMYICEKGKSRTSSKRWFPEITSQLFADKSSLENLAVCLASCSHSVSEISLSLLHVSISVTFRETSLLLWLHLTANWLHNFIIRMIQLCYYMIYWTFIWYHQSLLTYVTKMAVTHRIFFM